MSSAVCDLQLAIAEGEQPLTQLLRKAKLMAAKLNLEDVEQWIDYELKGYPPEVTLPGYRHITSIHLENHNPVRGWVFVGNLHLKLDARQPVAELQSLANADVAYTTPPQPVPLQDNSVVGVWKIGHNAWPSVPLTSIP